MDRKETYGDINISHAVYCPYCSSHFDDFYNKDWFDKTMGSDFPVDDGYKTEFRAKCPECKKRFIIKGFRH